MGEPGPRDAVDACLVSWTTLPARLCSCKRSPSARLRRNVGGERFQRAWLARCSCRRARGEKMAGGSSRHLARVTAPFPAIHRVYIPFPAAFLLGCSPFVQLQQQVFISSFLLLFFVSFLIDSSQPNPFPPSLFCSLRCCGSEHVHRQVNLVPQRLSLDFFLLVTLVFWRTDRFLLISCHT
jgi:hypothetical protein